jgi:chromosome segregation ATPase
MHDYVETLERQLAVIQEAREILQKKREEALSWLEEVESEINRVSSRLNEEKEYTQIRNEVEKLTGKTNELVSTAMEDLWETLRSMEVQLTRLSKFVDSADSQTLATSEREQLPEGGDVEIADSVDYAETVVSLTQEDVETSEAKSNIVGDKNRRVLT